ncbi:MAG: hypothetical protein JEY97_06190 [Bacteroidales bacterium]|nr:hypothetical protein [Bacteroidales bacterium]
MRTETAMSLIIAVIVILIAIIMPKQKEPFVARGSWKDKAPVPDYLKDQPKTYRHSKVKRIWDTVDTQNSEAKENAEMKGMDNDPYSEELYE